MVLCENTNSVWHFVLMFKTPPNPCLCQRLISPRRESAFYSRTAVPCVIKPPLWWNYLLLLVYCLEPIKYFSMIISFKPLRFLSETQAEGDERVGMILSSENHIPLRSCFLTLPLIPFPCQGYLALSPGTVCSEGGGAATLPPSSIYKRGKQLKGKLLHCQCLCYRMTVEITTLCWVTTQNLVSKHASSLSV